MRAVCAALAYLVLAATGLGTRSTWAGVTVHYEGRATDAAAIKQALVVARSEARRYGWEVKEASVENASVTRVIAEKERPYRGSLTGIVIYPHPMCEPLYIQFGSDLFMQDFVKTQFAGPDVHVKVVELLRKLRPFFNELRVEDEGEYWDTNDRSKLESHIATVNRMIAEIRRTHPEVKGPIRIPSGRIVDVIQ